MATSVPGTSTSMRSAPDIVKQGIYETSSEQLHPLGTRLEIGDGRVFHYAQNSAAATLDASKVLQAAIPLVGHLKLNVAATALVGATRVSVTLATTAATVNLYAGGYLNVDNGGAYNYYKIKDHLAITLTGTGWFNLYDPIVAQITAGYKVTLIQNLWKNVIVAPATLTAVPIGVNIVSVVASYYFWAQTWGPCNVLMGTTAPAITVTGKVATVIGAVEANTAGLPIIGIMMRTEVAADYGMVFLTIAP